MTPLNLVTIEFQILQIGELMHVPPPGLLMPDDFKAYSKTKIDHHNFNK